MKCFTHKRRPLLYRIDERSQALNPDLQFVSGLNGTDAAGGAGENDVAGQQSHVGGDEADDLRRLEDELPGAGVLPELAVLKLLDA